MTGNAFDERDEFAPLPRGYRVTTADFEATVVPDDDRVAVAVELPTLSAAVVGDEVAEVVEEGWFETFERRVENVSGVAAAPDVEAPTATREGDRVVVETSFAPGPDPAGDALALVGFVEGTWVQGIVPGYEYEDRVEAIRSRARSTGEGGDATPL